MSTLITGGDIRVEVGRIARTSEDESWLVEALNTSTTAATVTDAVNMAGTGRVGSQAYQNWRVRWGGPYKGTATAVGATSLTDANATFTNAMVGGTVTLDGITSTVITSLTGTTVLNFANWVGSITPVVLTTYVVSYGTEGSKSFGLTLTPSTGALSISPSVTGLGLAEPVELWNKDAPDPDYVDQVRDRVLSQRCFRQRMVPTTLLNDGDMLASTTAAWTGSSATLQKIAGTIASGAEQVLQVTNTGANGYAGQTIDTQGGETFHIVAVANCASGTQAQIVVQDLTAGSALSLSAAPISVWAGTSYQYLRVQFAVPTTSKQISVRVGGSGASDVTNWCFVALWEDNAQTITLPSRINTPNLVGEVYEATGTQWPELSTKPINDQPDFQDMGGTGTRMQFSRAIGSRLLFWSETANYSALQSVYTTVAGRRAGDIATTICPLEYVVYEILNDMYSPSFVPIRGVLRRMPGKYEELLAKTRRKYAPPNQVRVFREQGVAVTA